MTDTLNNARKLWQAAKTKLETTSTPADLEAWRVEYLGRKGAIPLFLRQIKELSAEEKKTIGQEANAARQELERLFSEKKIALGSHPIDINPDEYPAGPGHLHPLTLTTRRIQNIFSALGFTIVEGPEVEEQRYNFDLLNISPEHPARAETDTFFIKDIQGSDNLPLILRTHVSPLQIRGPKEQNLKPPYSIFYYGRTFRPEKADATHESVFHQFEFMVVNKTASLSDLKGVIETFYSTFFQKSVSIRLRPSYFPFVEPGFEVDISCVFCDQQGCPICKQTGWIEIAGAGMVHPNVLRNANVDPNEYQGFALGGAIDRLAMLRYGIDDIRFFWSGDIRFLRQFS